MAPEGFEKSSEPPLSTIPWFLQFCEMMPTLRRREDKTEERKWLLRGTGIGNGRERDDCTRRDETERMHRLAFIEMDGDVSSRLI